MLKYPPPRWYQELSIPQMKRVFTLGKIIECDHVETVTGRTQKYLREIGITSTFVQISSKQIKQLFKASELDPARFLCEMYRFITGRYFEEEGYKKFYDCNERIVLSAIVFLKFPETIMELHRRLPMGKPIKLPKKPVLSIPEKKIRKPTESPYLEEIGEQPDWRSYRTQLQNWKEKVNSIVKPAVILPDSSHFEDHVKSILGPDQIYPSIQSRKVQKRIKTKRNRGSSIKHERKKSRESRSSRTEASTLQNNSVDDFSEIESFIKDLPKKYFPPGRENLSRKWQSWLHEKDIEFDELAEKADCLLNEVRDTTKLIFNPDACENCCACRQSRKKDMEKQDSMPLILIDTLIFDEDETKYVIGTLTLNSPAPSVSDFTPESPQIIPSEEKIIKRKIISDVILDANDQPKYLISEVIKDFQHIPKKIRHLPKSTKNVLPCNCKVDHAIVDADVPRIPCAVNGECIAKKYRSNEFFGCRKCSDEHSTNKIYRDFEEACRKREDRKKQWQIAIDHTTCTQRLCHNNKIEVVVEPEPEKCTECHEGVGKCRANPFTKIIDKINQSKLIDTPKVSRNSEMKVYRDNIKFAVGGIINTDNPDKTTGCILSGVTMHTPITITPSSSSTESDLPHLSSSQHHHWSVTAFTPKPKLTKPRKRNARYFNLKPKGILNESTQKVIDEMFSKIRQLDLPKQECNDKLIIKRDENAMDISETDKPELLDKTKRSRTLMARMKGGADDDTVDNNDGKGKKKPDEKIKLPQLMKIILREMAEEGFLLAKLPDCHKIPQLQAWIMFREGFVLTGKQKSALLERTKQLWTQAESRSPEEISAPTLQISEKQRETLTRADIHRIEQELKLKVKLFHSKIRKLRVLESRAMWNLMDYQIFPSLAFKQAYFIYQASKESDGHVERPYGFSR